jgi:hypothetical protein
LASAVQRAAGLSGRADDPDVAIYITPVVSGREVYRLVYKELGLASCHLLASTVKHIDLDSVNDTPPRSR